MSHRRADHSSYRRRRLFCRVPQSRASQNGPASTPRRGRVGSSSHPQPCRSLSHRWPQGTPALSGNWFNRGDDTSIRHLLTYSILFSHWSAVSVARRVVRRLIQCRRATVWCADATVWWAPPALVPVPPLLVPAPWVVLP